MKRSRRFRLPRMPRLLDRADLLTLARLGFYSLLVLWFAAVAGSALRLFEMLAFGGH